MAHDHLEMDVVYIAELTCAGHLCRAVAGEAGCFDINVDPGEAAEGAYCAQLAEGVLPTCIPDAASEGGVADLPGACRGLIGSFVGVPLRYSDGTLYGALCGLSKAPAPQLNERDVRFLSMMGNSIVGDLDEQRDTQQLRSRVIQLIETEDVRIAYQPIMDLATNECLGVEALARFPAPFGSPDQAIATAETFGLDIELERLAVSKAWEAIPLLGPQQYLALNLGPRALVELASRANTTPDLPLSQLVIEVTEHSAVDSYAALHRELNPLRERGLRVAVDDAGAGYASLRHVLELRPDFIKVDRSLIHGISSDHARRVAVSGFLSLALDLGSTVVAEGVERAADLSAVRELGLHAAQGYLLGRPTTSLDGLTRWIGPRAGREKPRLRQAATGNRRRRASVSVLTNGAA
jgi:EAL domain-containing protein (putative c-di-GMP-specific phosphodiesterase class I)